MPRGRRALLQRQVSDDEFETPAFRETGEKQDRSGEQEDSDSDELEFQEIDESEEGSSDGDDLEMTTKPSDDDDDDDDDDSDDAPEDVGFSESKKKALSQMRDVMNQMKEEKQQLKKKRKLKDEKYKEQKRLKLGAMTRLSEDVINSLPEKINEPLKVDTSLRKRKKKSKGDKEENAVKEETRKHISYEETEDYIPLEAGIVDSESGIKVMSLKDMRKKLTVSQSAANFKNSRLYGDPRQRESTKAYLAKMEKRKVTQRRR